MLEGLQAPRMRVFDSAASSHDPYLPSLWFVCMGSYPLPWNVCFAHSDTLTLRRAAQG